jgi:FkbM family methyltransferase
VVPIEPHPRAAEAIRAVAATNRLTNVDLSRLGVAVAAEPGRLSAIDSAGGGLGAMRFVRDPAGAIAATPLDRLIDGPIELLKVDVEGMEMEVLAGAAALIATHRPYIYIEVLDAGVSAFTAWVDANDYRIEKLFPDKTHCNYFLAPAEAPGRVPE